MEFGRLLLRLLVILLGFCHLTTLHAVPSTRTQSLMRENRLHRVPLLTRMDDLDIAKNFEERMTVELNDYPGSGPNHRHTPDSSWP